MSKKILYIDMDGVIADFHHGVQALDPEANPQDYHKGYDYVDQICRSNPNIFHNLIPIDGAIKAVNTLFMHFDIYFLSTPMWSVPESFTGKRLWIARMFGEKATKRLILTHRKDLAIGDYLIDDSIRNGAGEFKGTLIPFGTDAFPDWKSVVEYLLPTPTDLVDAF